MKNLTWPSLTCADVPAAQRVWELGGSGRESPGSLLNTDASPANLVTLNVKVTVGHDSATGEDCALSGDCDVTGGARVVKGVLVGSHAVALTHGAAGAYIAVGAGSVVLRGVRPHTTLTGIPDRALFDAGGAEPRPVTGWGA